MPPKATQAFRERCLVAYALHSLRAGCGADVLGTHALWLLGDWCYSRLAQLLAALLSSSIGSPHLPPQHMGLRLRVCLRRAARRAGSGTSSRWSSSSRRSTLRSAPR